MYIKKITVDAYYNLQNASKSSVSDYRRLQLEYEEVDRKTSIQIRLFNAADNDLIAELSYSKTYEGKESGPSIEVTHPITKEQFKAICQEMLTDIQEHLSSVGIESTILAPEKGNN